MALTLQANGEDITLRLDRDPRNGGANLKFTAQPESFAGHSLPKFVAGLDAFAGNLVAPYRSAAGQAWLIIPCTLWAICLIWLRRLTRYDLGVRYRLRQPDTERA